MVQDEEFAERGRDALRGETRPCLGASKILFLLFTRPLVSSKYSWRWPLAEGSFGIMLESPRHPRLMSLELLPRMIGFGIMLETFVFYALPLSVM